MQNCRGMKPGRRRCARQIEAHAVTDTPLDVLEVVCNGAVVHRLVGQGRRDMTLSRSDDAALAGLAPERELAAGRFAYYYLRVRDSGGGCGWSSPVWVGL